MPSFPEIRDIATDILQKTGVMAPLDAVESLNPNFTDDTYPFPDD